MSSMSTTTNDNKINAMNQNHGRTATNFQEKVQQFRSSDDDLVAEHTTQQEYYGSSTLQSDATGTTQQDATLTSDGTAQTTNHHTFHFVPLKMNGRTHKYSSQSKELIEKEVTLEDLTRMTTAFYNLAFQDATLDKFIRSHNDPHGARFAKWIHQKLTGSHIWDEDCRQRRDDGDEYFAHDRTSAHVAAWHSHKRPPADHGRRFTLEDCRVWMRLHFLAMRQCGIVDQSPAFADYYVRFIGHFVAVYENTAPAFCRESFRWSADPANVHAYIHTHQRKMVDVLGGKSLEEACRDLPEEEIRDHGMWQYVKNNYSGAPSAI